MYLIFLTEKKMKLLTLNYMFMSNVKYLKSQTIFYFLSQRLVHGAVKVNQDFES